MNLSKITNENLILNLDVLKHGDDIDTVEKKEAIAYL